MANAQAIDNRFAAESASFDRVANKDMAKRNKELLKIAAELTALKEALEGSRDGAPAPKAAAPKEPKGQRGEAMNPLFLLYEAVGRSQDSESQQQIVDSKTAEADVAREEAIYYYWNEAPGTYRGAHYNGRLGYDAAVVAWCAGQGKKDASYVTEWQTKFNEDSSTAQAAEGQSDGAVQSAQNQTSGDASNNQKMVQMIGTINTILSTTAQMLAQGLQ